MSQRIDFDLRGKDWLTEAEAAHYCGVSLTQFREHASRFRARRFLGKKLFSRAELFSAIETSEPWNPIPKSDRTHSSVSAGTAAKLRPEPLRAYKPRGRPGG